MSEEATKQREKYAPFKMNFDGLSVTHRKILEGGGFFCYRDYARAIREQFGKVESLYEWCAGSGVIGFYLLSQGLCDRLCLSDVNPLAVETMRETVKENGLEGRVTIYHSDGLKDIRGEAWDLVISNPPHYYISESEYDPSRHLLGYDPDWKFHRKFYSKIGPYLRPGGSLMLLESYEGSREGTFLPLMALGGLNYHGSFMIPNSVAAETFKGLNRFFFVLSGSGKISRNKNFLWDDVTPIRTLKVDGKDLHVSDRERCRLHFVNYSTRALHVKILSADGTKLWPFPSTLKVMPSQSYISGLFLLEKGEYQVVEVDEENPDNYRVLARIESS